MRTLIIAPHLDDEAISCGGLILARVAGLQAVSVLFMHGRKYGYKEWSDKERTQEWEDCAASCKILGCDMVGTSFLFEEGEPGKVGYYDLLERIECSLQDFQPTEVVIPSGDDLNQDHRHLNHVCKIALRPVNLKNVKRVLEFCALDGIVHQPNYFVPMNSEQMETKLTAIKAYRRESREVGPRAPIVVWSQAKVWGAMCGAEFAEGYKLVFERE